MQRSGIEYPYRDILSHGERTQLSQPRPERVLIDIATAWLLIFGAWTSIWILGMGWAVPCAMIIIGNRYYSLYIIGHDGLHRRLHRDARTNDLINDTLILAPICAITRVNRLNHMQHHRTLGAASDPDLFKYRSREHLSPLQMLISFTGLPLVMQALHNVFSPKRSEGSPGRPEYRTRDLALLALWQIALIGGLTYVFGWWGYLLLWLVPIATLTVAFDLLRVFVEHSVEHETTETKVADRLIMVTSSSLERLIFAPNNMNHHVAHHLWPTIPYFNLPAATRMLEERVQASGERILRRSGYCAYLLQRVITTGRSGRILP